MDYSTWLPCVIGWSAKKIFMLKTNLWQASSVSCIASGMHLFHILKNSEYSPSSNATIICCWIKGQNIVTYLSTIFWCNNSSFICKVWLQQRKLLIWNFYNHKTDVAYQIIKNEYKEIKVIKLELHFRQSTLKSLTQPVCIVYYATVAATDDLPSLHCILMQQQ